MNWNITYAKYGEMKSYKAFDLQNGVPVGNIIYATSLENTEDNRRKLQELADLNKAINLSLQLRKDGKIIFQTK